MQYYIMTNTLIKSALLGKKTEYPLFSSMDFQFFFFYSRRAEINRNNITITTFFYEFCEVAAVVELPVIGDMK